MAIVAAADMKFAGAFAIGLGHSGVVIFAVSANSPIIALVFGTLGTLAIATVSLVHFQAGNDIATIVNGGIFIVALWTTVALVIHARVRRNAGSAATDAADRDGMFRAVFDQTFQFVLALDPRGKIIDANQTFLDYVGLTKKEIEAMPVWLLPLFQNEPEVRERLRTDTEAAAEGDFVRAELSLSGNGDQTTIIDMSMKPIRSDTGTVRQIILEARDATEARTQQQMLVQAQKMEAVGELTAGVAHDFNNLLTVIVGNLELLEKRIDGNDAAKDRLDRAVAAAFRGQALTQQLLAFSRRQSLNPVVLDVNTLLRGMSQLYDSLGDNVAIRFDLAPEPLLCEVDPILLETALLNIAINSRDAMPGGGVLSFQTSSAVLDRNYHGEVTDLPPGRYVCLAITDTGVGIPQEIVSNVFEPFFTTKSDGEGTGLGLSLVYGFVKQSGGDVKIYSELGKGTTIRIYLPETSKPLTPVITADRDPAKIDGTQGLVVLLVDDDDEVRETVLNGMQECGFEVETVRNGDEAIHLIRAGNTYDLIFTDMIMKGEAGGPDVARAARAVTPDVPIVFCSGFPRNSLHGEETSVDGAVFLPKPFRQEELVVAVEQALARARQRRTASHRGAEETA